MREPQLAANFLAEAECAMAKSQADEHACDVLSIVFDRLGVHVRVLHVVCRWLNCMPCGMPRQQENDGVYAASFSLDVRHVACHTEAMNKDEARAALKAIDLAAFAKRSKVPLRTLARIRAGEGNPTQGTLALLAADLKRIKPQPKTKHKENEE